MTKFLDGVGTGVEEARAFGSWEEEGVFVFLVLNFIFPWLLILDVACRWALIGNVMFVLMIINFNLFTFYSYLKMVSIHRLAFCCIAIRLI